MKTRPSEYVKVAEAAEILGVSQRGLSLGRVRQDPDAQESIATHRQKVLTRSKLRTNNSVNMCAPSFKSPNFGFLAKHDVILLKHAALAERYVFDDTNSSLIKLRQFAELLAEHRAAYAAIPVDEQDSFLNVLDKLWNAGVLGVQVSQLFHGIRKSGNVAAHGHTGDRREALHQLQMTRKLAIWFHRTFGNDETIEAGSFMD